MSWQTSPRATECKEIMRDWKTLHARMAGTVMNNKQKGQVPLPRCHEQSRVPCMIPAHSTTRGAGRPPKLPFRPIHPNLPLPSSRFRNHPPSPSSAMNKGTCFLFSFSLAAAWVPQSLARFFSYGLLSISVDSRIQESRSVTQCGYLHFHSLIVERSSNGQALLGQLEVWACLSSAS